MQRPVTPMDGELMAQLQRAIDLSAAVEEADPLLVADVMGAVEIYDSSAASSVGELSDVDDAMAVLDAEGDAA